MSYDDPYGDMGVPTGSSRRPQGQRSGGRGRSGGGGSFNLGSYVEVKDRIRKFYERYPEGRITSEVITGLSHIQSIETVQVTKTKSDGTSKTQEESIAVGYIAVMAHAYRTPDDPHPATGMSAMLMPGTTEYTRGSELENAETSAWGRALANLDILNEHSIASRDEVSKARGGDDVDAEIAAAEAFAAAQAAATAESPRGGPTEDVSAPAAPESATDTPAAPEAKGEAPSADEPGITEADFPLRIKDHFIPSATVNSTRIGMFPESRSYKELTDQQRHRLFGALMDNLEAAKAAADAKA